MLRYSKIVPVQVEVVYFVPSEEKRRLRFSREIGCKLERLDLVLEHTFPLLEKHRSRWATIIAHHYGLFGKEPLSVNALAAELGVSRSRIYEMHRHAIAFIINNRPRAK